MSHTLDDDMPLKDTHIVVLLTESHIHHSAQSY